MNEKTIEDKFEEYNDMLNMNIDSISELTTVLNDFKKNILPSMKIFNENFVEFMGQKEVKLKSIDGAVNGYAYDMGTVKTDVGNIKENIATKKDIEKILEKLD